MKSAKIFIDDIQEELERLKSLEMKGPVDENCQKTIIALENVLDWFQAYLGTKEKFEDGMAISALQDGDSMSKIRALKRFRIRNNIPIHLLKKCLDDSDIDVRCEAYRSCRCNRQVPIEWLKKGMRDPNPDIRESAFYACEGRTDIIFDNKRRI